MTKTLLRKGLSACFVTAIFIMPQATSAHPNGAQSYTFQYGAGGRASSCNNAHKQAKRMLRRDARAHCILNHDSSGNILQRTGYSRGTCTKTKQPGQRAYYEIHGAVYTATCR